MGQGSEFHVSPSPHSRAPGSGRLACRTIYEVPAQPCHEALSPGRVDSRLEQLLRQRNGCSQEKETSQPASQHVLLLVFTHRQERGQESAFQVTSPSCTVSQHPLVLTFPPTHPPTIHKSAEASCLHMTLPPAQLKCQEFSSLQDSPSRGDRTGVWPTALMLHSNIKAPFSHTALYSL